MKFSKTVDELYLSKLSQQIQSLPSDEASSLLFEGATLVLFAGYPDIAYQLFVKLTQGNLAISEESTLARPIKSIIPGLCYELGIPSPMVFSQQEMSLSELERYMNKNLREYEDVSGIVFGIRTYLKLNDFDNADRYIKKCWESLNHPLSALYLVGYLPDLMKRISAGVLQDYIKITQIQALEFLDSVNQRKHEPKVIGFIPTVEDWQNFLQKWDKAIFDKLVDDYKKSYEDWFPETVKRKNCLNQGATEEEINFLEEKLQTKLPLSYKNFLLASNGFTILNEYCKLYGTDEIKWFVENNREWAEA